MMCDVMKTTLSEDTVQRSDLLSTVLQRWANFIKNGQFLYKSLKFALENNCIALLEPLKLNVGVFGTFAK
jgi:hypothetical protein